MASLFFPQLLSGSMVQYPVRKLKQFRTVVNVYGDGRMTVYPDSGARRLGWQIRYNGISKVEVAALQSLYVQCGGPLLPFTFIDPVDNMLVASSDFTNSSWIGSPGCKVSEGVVDPTGGSAAFSLTNAGQQSAGVTQNLQVPSNYQYCFSVYVRSSDSAPLTLNVAGASASGAQTFVSCPNWTRVRWSGRVNDAGTVLSVSLLTGPGQTIDIYGPQLEAQQSPSTYKATVSRGGVYPACHWTNSELSVTSMGPGVFATEFGIETSL